jgi:hypothetical protein
VRARQALAERKTFQYITQLQSNAFSRCAETELSCQWAPVRRWREAGSRTSSRRCWTRQAPPVICFRHLAAPKGSCPRRSLSSGKVSDSGPAGTKDYAFGISVSFGGSPLSPNPECRRYTAMGDQRSKSFVVNDDQDPRSAS